MGSARALDLLNAESVVVDMKNRILVDVDLEVEAVVVELVVADSVAVDLESVKPCV